MLLLMVLILPGAHVWGLCVLVVWRRCLVLRGRVSRTPSRLLLFGARR